MVSPFYADLHIHSKYSRACSRDCDLEHLTWWARRKGITLVGTGDFTHPAWFDHLRETLVPDGNGLYRMSPDKERDIQRKLPPAVQGPVRYMLSVEISTIYKRDDKTRKVHHLVYLPDFDAVSRFNAALSKIGNLGSDGRPILGLDSRNLLEITLQASPDGYLVPAHVWTPWFAALGSKSGFDAIADCYADLADHIFAIETGLSSDPAMNWRVSSLDRYRLVSNSDAHSPPALGREATVFETEVDYFAVRRALETGEGFGGTVEFFPEEGKYHADGHRNCEVRWDPEQTRAAGGRCPECGKPLTVGVLHRVEALADRAYGERPAGAAEFRNLVQLPEIVGEIHGVGPRSKTVDGKVNAMVAALGPELSILTEVPVDDIGRHGGERVAEAIRRLRAGDVRREAGYDGEYGVIRLFDPDELRGDAGMATLFDIPDSPPAVPKPRVAAERRRAHSDQADRRRAPVEPEPPEPVEPELPEASPHVPLEPVLLGMEEVGTGLLDRLDAMQRVAASAPGGPLLIVAGPGTGKTRTLTHRIAYLVADLGVPPEQCLAITFTRRAAEEMRERLHALLPEQAGRITVTTFHALGLQILRAHPDRVGLAPGFRVADVAVRDDLRKAAGSDEAYVKALREDNLVDVDELVTLPVALLDDDELLIDRYRAKWPWVFVDEYQDVDPVQYQLLTLLAPHDGNLCAIGDPDQAIYAFRGADVRFFLRFTQDFADARVVRLTRNYRSAAPILAAAVQAIAPTTLVQGRILEPAKRDPDPRLVGLYAATDTEDEAAYVTRTIDDLVGGVSHQSIHSGRASGDASTIGFGDIAVLYRTDAQAAVLVDALSRAGIPAQKRSHDRLRDRVGVAAIGHELRFVTSTPGVAVAGRVRRAAQSLTERLADGPAQHDASLTEADLQIAVDLLGPLAARCGDDLDQFLAELATGAEVDAWDPRADRVTLLTLHAAKGLEFPVVFLVGCEDGLLPMRLPGSALSDEEVAEERRLFFVGMTRAQDRLYISHAARRFRYGTERQTSPSPFLAAIDPNLLDQRGTQAVQRRPRDRQPRLF